jgi:hypothetical protein
MKTYYRLVDEIAIPMRWHLGWAELADRTEPQLRSGLRFESSEIPSIPVTSAGHILDFSITSFAVPVVTKQLADAVSATAGADVQCVPVSISGQSGMVVLNSLRVVRCVDESRSEFTKWTEHDHRADLAGQYRSLSKLVLDATSIPANARFFRIEGSLVELIVSEDVKATMESVGCFGAKFIELETSAPTSIAR